MNKEKKMQKTAMTVMAIFLMTFFTACASQETVKKGEMQAKMPINCPSAEADIRVLESEKTHASEQLATGVTTIVPIGLFTSAAMGTTGTNVKVATGDYNKMLDDKIAEIKKTCGVK
jgi:hypothetical protein